MRSKTAGDGFHGNNWVVEKTLSPIIMVQSKMDVSPKKIVTFQIVRHFPLNHEYGRKSNRDP